MVAAAVELAAAECETLHLKIFKLQLVNLIQLLWVQAVLLVKQVKVQFMYLMVNKVVVLFFLEI